MAGVTTTRTGASEPLTLTELSRDFLMDVGLGNIPGYSIVKKFGYNDNLGTSPEVIWNASVLNYGGFNAVDGEAIEVHTTSGTSDTGSVVSSGTATGGSSTTIVDSGATFSSDGVAVGDAVVNDTLGAHGIVTEVTSETTLTVWDMHGGATNASGNSYRVVTATGTGCALFQLSYLLESDYSEAVPEYIVMNGSTYVATTGTDYIRCSRGRAVLFGSSGETDEQVTARQETTTANIFLAMNAGENSSQVCCWTVPAGKEAYLVGSHSSLAKTNNIAVDFRFEARPFGQGFNLQDRWSFASKGSSRHSRDISAPGGPYRAGTDLQVRAVSTANNTDVGAGFDLLVRTV